MSLHYDKSELEIDNVDTPAPVHPMLLPFFTPAETMASPPEDDDNISLVSLTSASRRSAMPTSVHQDFPQVMTIAQRPPKPVSQGRVFTAHLTHPRRRSCHPPSLAFNSVFRHHRNNLLRQTFLLLTWCISSGCRVTQRLHTH